MADRRMSQVRQTFELHGTMSDITDNYTLECGNCYIFKDFVIVAEIGQLIHVIDYENQKIYNWMAEFNPCCKIHNLWIVSVQSQINDAL